MSKLVICENCFMEQSSVNKFCSCCGEPITKNKGYDIYNKNEKYYLRYRKDSIRAQTPLAPNYPTLTQLEKRNIYTEAKKVLSTKIAARTFIIRGTIENLNTFGDLMDNYINYIGNYKLNGRSRNSIKSSTFSNGYLAKAKILKQCSLCNLQIRDINYETLKTALTVFIKQRMSGEISGRTVKPEVIASELAFLKRVIFYSFEEELITLSYGQIQKLFRFIYDITPIDANADEDSTERIGLSTEQYENFLLNFFTEWPAESPSELFATTLEDHKQDEILYNLLQLCFLYYSKPDPDLVSILSICKKNTLRMLQRDYTNSRRYGKYRQLCDLIEAKHTAVKSTETLDNFTNNLFNNYTIKCLDCFPQCYKRFSEIIETQKFNGIYYPVHRSYYHGTERQTATKFDITRKDAVIIYKRLNNRFKEGNSVPTLLFLFMSQTGLRCSEAISLTLGDITKAKLSNNTEISVVKVTHQLSYTIQLDEKNKPVVKDDGDFAREFINSSPKTKSSKRVIPLTPIAVYAIEQATKLSHASQPEDLIFLHNGEHLKTRSIGDYIQRCLTNIRCNDLSGTHLLRKTVASQLARHGYTKYYIMQVLGHAKNTTTDIYVNIDLENLYHALTESLVPDWLRERFPIY